jgi:hypothetical protein
VPPKKVREGKTSSENNAQITHSARSECCSAIYLHRMARELVHDDGVFWLIE